MKKGYMNRFFTKIKNTMMKTEVKKDPSEKTCEHKRKDLCKCD